MFIIHGQGNAQKCDKHVLRRYRLVLRSSRCSRLLLFLKTLLLAAISVLATTELAYNVLHSSVSPAEWVYCACLVTCSVVCAAVLWSDGGAVSSSSAALFAFWLAATVLHLPALKAAVQRFDREFTVVGASVQILLFPLFLGLLLLECLSVEATASGEDGASLPSRLTFGWITPLVKVGFGRTIRIDDDFPEVTDYD